MVNGSTPTNAIISSQTLTAIINADNGTLDQNGYADANINYHDTKEDNKDGVKKCIRGDSFYFKTAGEIHLRGLQSAHKSVQM